MITWLWNDKFYVVPFLNNIAEMLAHAFRFRVQEILFCHYMYTVGIWKYEIIGIM